jgi:hypothetical protein
MLSHVFILVAAMTTGGDTGNAMTIEQDGVRIVATVQAQVYTWHVTNIDAAPIMRFSVQHHNTYNHGVPSGWEHIDEDSVLTAWTNDPRMAIGRGQTRSFDARSGSAGSMLGPVTLTLGFDSDSQDITVAGVWGPAPKHRGIVVLVALALVIIGLFHTAMVRRSMKRQTSA